MVEVPPQINLCSSFQSSHSLRGICYFAIQRGQARFYHKHGYIFLLLHCYSADGGREIKPACHVLCVHGYRLFRNTM